MLGSDCEDLVIKLDFFFGFRDAGPIFVDRGPATQGFVEGRHLISGIVCVQRGGGLGVTAGPCASIGSQPMTEDFSVHICFVAYYTSTETIRCAWELLDCQTRNS